MMTRSGADRPGSFSARRLVRAALVVMVALAGVAIATDAPALAADDAGGLRTIVPNDNPTVPEQLLSEGGSATEFTMLPPLSAACAGDTVSDGYTVHTFMVPASVDLSTLTFSATGPVPNGVGADFRQPLLFSGSAYIAKPTAPESGFLTLFPAFSLDLFNSTILPEGDYLVGYMCVAEGGAVLDRYWDTTMTITHDSADSPGGFTWTVLQTGSTTTTTTTTEGGSTTTTEGGSTTTTAGGSTTTTGGGSTTTEGGSTTTTAAGGSTTTLVAGPSTTFGSGTGTGGSGFTSSGGGGQLAFTGAGFTIGLLALALMLLALGRIVVLAGRPIKVKPPRP